MRKGITAGRLHMLGETVAADDNKQDNSPQSGPGL